LSRARRQGSFVGGGACRRGSETALPGLPWTYAERAALCPSTQWRRRGAFRRRPASDGCLARPRRLMTSWSTWPKGFTATFALEGPTGKPVPLLLLRADPDQRDALLSIGHPFYGRDPAVIASRCGSPTTPTGSRSVNSWPKATGDSRRRNSPHYSTGNAVSGSARVPDHSPIALGVIAGAASPEAPVMSGREPSAHAECCASDGLHPHRSDGYFVVAHRPGRRQNVR
jgi:hypothetical protein